MKCHEARKAVHTLTLGMAPFGVQSIGFDHVGQQRKAECQEVHGEEGETEEVTLAAAFSAKEGFAGSTCARRREHMRHIWNALTRA